MIRRATLSRAGKSISNLDGGGSAYLGRGARRIEASRYVWMAFGPAPVKFPPRVGGRPGLGPIGCCQPSRACVRRTTVCGPRRCRRGRADRLFRISSFPLRRTVQRERRRTVHATGAPGIPQQRCRIKRCPPCSSWISTRPGVGADVRRLCDEGPDRAPLRPILLEGAAAASAKVMLCEPSRFPLPPRLEKLLSFGGHPTGKAPAGLQGFAAKRYQRDLHAAVPLCGLSIVKALSDIHSGIAHPFQEILVAQRPSARGSDCRSASVDDMAKGSRPG